MSGRPGWLHVAQKDLQDSARSKLLLGVIGVLLTLSVGLGAVPYLTGQKGSDGAEAAAAFLNTPVSVFLPVLGAMIGYMAIVNERESGSIRVLLGLPLRRSDVVVGKTIGRAAVLVGAVVLAGLVGILVSLGLYGTAEWSVFAAYGLIGILLSVVYVALAIAVSASTDSRGKAMAAIVGVLLLFVYAWQIIVLGVVLVVERTAAIEGEAPNYALFLFSLDPGVVASRVAGLVFGDTIGDPLSNFAGTAPSDLPFYLQRWTALVLLALWITVPLAIGYWRFGNADL